MDIFEWAKDYPNADYFDHHTGYIYHVADYMRAKNSGLPTEGILVSYNGELIGIVRESNNLILR